MRRKRKFCSTPGEVKGLKGRRAYLNKGASTYSSLDDIKCQPYYWYQGIGSIHAPIVPEIEAVVADVAMLWKGLKLIQGGLGITDDDFRLETGGYLWCDRSDALEFSVDYETGELVYAV